MSIQLTQREYIAVLALASAAILGIGVFMKPQELPEATISSEDAQRLQLLTQRRNLENLADYFSKIADGVQPSLVWLDESQTTGLVWNEERLIVTAGPSQFPPKVKAFSIHGDVDLEPTILSGDFQATALKPAESADILQPVRVGTPNALSPGMWILQVVRQAGGTHLFTPGVFGGTTLTKCGELEHQTLQSSLPLGEAALGGGLFDVDGNLLGIILRCDGQIVAVTPDDVNREMQRATSFPGKLLQTYGLRVTSLDEVAKQYFDSKDGVLVTEVTDEHLAAAASLAPGDIITMLDKTPVRVPEDLLPLTMLTDPPVYQLEIRRNRRTVRIETTSLPSTPTKDYRGIELTEASEGFLIETVSRGSRAERAGIQPGDRILSLDGRRPPNLAAVRKALSSDDKDPIFVQLRRGARRIGAFLK